MSRRHSAQKRQILEDPKYGNEVVSKFINCLMSKGKKSVAERMVYGALEIVGQKLKKDELEVFLEALDNVKPAIEVRSRRVGGATYQVPVEVRADRSRALAIRWMINAARKRSEHTMRERLANELMEAYNKRGAAVTTRVNTHKMAEANKAFSHYRW